MSLVAFTLTMPGIGSWNGRWSGSDKLYVRVLNLPADQARGIVAYQPYSYDFGDGWLAAIAVRLVDSAEARRLRTRSAGFCSYDWMLEEIQKHGRILQRAERIRTEPTP